MTLTVCVCVRVWCVCKADGGHCKTFHWVLQQENS